MHSKQAYSLNQSLTDAPQPYNITPLQLYVQFLSNENGRTYLVEIIELAVNLDIPVGRDVGGLRRRQAEGELRLLETVASLRDQRR
jgi:hypothetical protein